MKDIREEAAFDPPPRLFSPSIIIPRGYSGLRPSTNQATGFRYFAGPSARNSKFKSHLVARSPFYLSPTPRNLERPMFHEHALRARSKFNQTSKRLPAPAEARSRIAIRGFRTNFRFYPVSHTRTLLFFLLCPSTQHLSLSLSLFLPFSPSLARIHRELHSQSLPRPTNR